MNELFEGDTFIVYHKNPPAVKRVLQKVANFTQFLEFLKCKCGKLKEVESFSIVEEGSCLYMNINP